MNTGTPLFSDEFMQLYCDAGVYDRYSALHPINFRRVLPFQYEEEGVDIGDLLRAEETHLDERSDATRLAVLDEYCRCGLLEETEVKALRPIIDFYDADFFELMGLVYANARRFRCALRWYRELIRDLETKKPESRSDNESVYASVGYCFYSLRLFEEAIAWSKACIGPRPTADAMSRALIDYEAQLRGGAIRKVERVASRTRYLVSTFDFEPAHASQSTARLKAAIQGFAPFQETYIDWVTHETGTDVASRPGMQPCDYPFEAEIDGSSLVRHKLNLIFATCGLADALVERGYVLEAKRLLSEAALIEPEAGIVREKLRAFM